MPTDDNRKKYGEYLRSVREGLGLDRDQFARRLGVSSMTVRNCENGHQSLGRAAKRAVETLADPHARFGGTDEVRDTSQQYDVTGGVSMAKAVAKMAARIATDEELQAKVHGVQKALSVSYERAVEIVVREMVEGSEA